MDRSNEGFSRNVSLQGKLNDSQLVDAVRRDIMGEMEAIIQYDEHIRMTDNELAKRVWTDIRNEERVHVGELLTLLIKLSPDETKFLAEGEKEVNQLIQNR